MPLRIPPLDPPLTMTAAKIYCHTRGAHIAEFLPLSVLRQLLWRATLGRAHHRLKWTQTSRLRCRPQMVAEKQR